MSLGAMGKRKKLKINIIKEESKKNLLGPKRFSQSNRLGSFGDISVSDASHMQIKKQLPGTSNIGNNKAKPNLIPDNVIAEEEEKTPQNRENFNRTNSQLDRQQSNIEVSGMGLQRQNLNFFDKQMQGRNQIHQINSRPSFEEESVNSMERENMAQS